MLGLRRLFTQSRCSQYEGKRNCHEIYLEAQGYFRASAFGK